MSRELPAAQTGSCTSDELRPNSYTTGGGITGNNQFTLNGTNMGYGNIVILQPTQAQA